MAKRIFTVLVSALLTWLSVVSAQAAQPAPLVLSSYVIQVAAPNAPATKCDTGSELHCGYVSVAASFSGLSGRSRAGSDFYDGELTGIVHVVRTYGCQSTSGHRRKKYDRVVALDVPLETRRSTGFHVPAEGDQLNITTFAFLLDAQPGNCPPHTQAMTYKIKASHVRLMLTSYVPSIPSAAYSAPGQAKWKGAVPTPTAPTAPTARQRA